MMSSWPRYSLGVSVMLWFLLISQVKNEGKLDIKFIRYTSDGRVPGGLCCESWISTSCDDACDPKFTMCVKELRHTEPCSLSMRTTAGMHTGSNHVVFGNSIQGTPNPFIIQIDSAMPSSIKIRVTVYDEDLDDEDDYMDTLEASVNISASPSKIMSVYKPCSLQGSTHLEIVARAYCDPDWYGADCLTYCKASTPGHYSCHFSKGTKLCFHGWKGDNCDEDVDECSERSDLCKHDGSCTNTPGGFECRCLNGTHGRNCELVTNRCALNKCLNGGTCNGNETDFSCTCPVWWSGETCAEEINVCDSALCDRGNCVPQPDTSAGFRCECEFPWTGETCDVIVDITNITVLGVTDDNNRDNLNTGLAKVINDLGEIQGHVNVVASTHIDSESIHITTQVQFYVTLENGTILTSDFVREIFSSHSDGDINKYLPLPFYRVRDTDGQETDITTQETKGGWFRSNWYMLAGTLSAGLVLVALCVAFLLWRRKSHELEQMLEDNQENVTEMDEVNRTVQDLHRRTADSEEDARASTHGSTHCEATAIHNSGQEVTYTQPIPDTLPGENCYSRLATPTGDNSRYEKLGGCCQKGSNDNADVIDVNVDGATKDHPYEDVNF